MPVLTRSATRNAPCLVRQLEATDQRLAATQAKLQETEELHDEMKLRHNEAMETNHVPRTRLEAMQRRNWHTEGLLDTMKARLMLAEDAVDTARDLLQLIHQGKSLKEFPREEQNVMN